MLKLEARPEASRFMAIASPLLALAITVLIGTLLFLALGKGPAARPAGLLRRAGEERLRALRAGDEGHAAAAHRAGLAVCFRSNVWNIGAEGQFVIGAIFAGGTAMQAGPETGRWFVIVVLLAGVVGGMVWAGIVALLRDRFNASEIWSA